MDPAPYTYSPPPPPVLLFTGEEHQGYPTTIAADGATFTDCRFHCGDFNARGVYDKPSKGNANLSGTEADALKIHARNVIVEHSTIAWGMDENLEIWPKDGRPADKITVRYCLNAHSLWHSYHPGPVYKAVGHGMGAIVGSGAKRILFYRNLHVHHEARALLDVTAHPEPVTVTVANCVVYNWVWECFKFLKTVPGTQINVIKCLFIEGPNTDWTPPFSSKPFRTDGSSGVYISGCKIWRLDGTIEDVVEDHLTAKERAALSPTRFADGTVRNKLVPAGQLLLDDVLANVGPRPPSSYENQIIQQVRNRTGHVIDSQERTMILTAIKYANSLRDYQSLVLSLTPLAYWPRPTNTTDARDITGNGKDVTGTCQIVESPIPGRADWAFGFTAASNNMMRDADFGGLTYPMTLAGWAKATDLALARTLMSVDDNTTNNFYDVVFTEAGAIRCRVKGGGVVQIATTSTTVAAGVWCHWAAVFASATDKRVYLNAGGVSQNVTSRTPGACTGLSIGNIASGTTQDFNGSIAHPAIWNRELTVGELTALSTVGLYGA